VSAPENEFQNEALLREEFDANIDLWKHEEGMRQKRSTVMLNANAFLAVGASAMISFRPSPEAAFLVGLVLSGFGLATCWIWLTLLQRHKLYATFRLKQIRELAARIGYESWENQWTGLRTNPPNDTPEVVVFWKTDERFEPAVGSRGANTVETFLPKAIAYLWACFAIGCLFFAITSW
jgi:hypothetical protein